VKNSGVPSSASIESGHSLN